MMTLFMERISLILMSLYGFAEPYGFRARENANGDIVFEFCNCGTWADFLEEEFVFTKEDREFLRMSDEECAQRSGLRKHRLAMDKKPFVKETRALTTLAANLQTHGWLHHFELRLTPRVFCELLFSKKVDDILGLCYEDLIF